MFTCAICDAREGRDEFVEEVFRVDETYVLVDHIPAHVCARCGEGTFSRETTERVHLMVHRQANPTKSIALKVCEFA